MDLISIKIIEDGDSHPFFSFISIHLDEVEQKSTVALTNERIYSIIIKEIVFLEEQILSLKDLVLIVKLF
jgi:hypothetical protein